jgi:hypothetical protein
MVFTIKLESKPYLPQIAFRDCFVRGQLCCSENWKRDGSHNERDSDTNDQFG